jgi:hypothetical protein
MITVNCLVDSIQLKKVVFVKSIGVLVYSIIAILMNFEG